jgi:hypothetical protein
MKISDSRLAGVLGAIIDGTAKARITPMAAEHAYDVELKLEVHDNHRRDSPDAVLDITVTLRHPRLPVMTLRVPIPIEGEVAGLGAAKEDLRKFAQRERFPIQLPMLVVGGVGSASHSSDEVRIKAKVSIDMIPYRQVAGS